MTHFKAVAADVVYTVLHTSTNLDYFVHLYLQVKLPTIGNKQTNHFNNEHQSNDYNNDYNNEHIIIVRLT